ncbi:MAG: cystathionine beta-lyase, partial [Romboutsia sp.]|nr:cystathionine beta-lyase [Romboutsia sp.]
MKKYNFDEIIDRTGTDSAKFDELKEKFGRDDLIPMWIADMDFLNAKEIEEAMIERAKHSIYGYTTRSTEYFEAVKNWQKYKNDWDVDAKYMSDAAGVLPMLANIFHAFAKEGDKVIIQTPVFSEFKKVANNWGLEVIDNPL